MNSMKIKTNTQIKTTTKHFKSHYFNNKKFIKTLKEKNHRHCF